MGQKRQEGRWCLGKARIKEIDEDKYLGMWLNRQVTGHNHVERLCERRLICTG